MTPEATDHRTPAGLAAKVAFLSRPESYPEGPSAVSVVETHMSYVFVTDELVYKLKKPVRTDFLDFSTLEKRRHSCEESIRLNRRLAPDVYLGMVALVRNEGGQLQIDGNGEPMEWLEKMVRLPESSMLDSAIREKRVRDEDIRRFTRVLAAFYKDAQPCELLPSVYRERFASSIEANDRELRDHAPNLDRQRLAALTSAQLALLDREPELLDARVAAGRVIEAHGDLRPEHVCLLPDPVFIDCLEFNREFRQMDTADELCCLALECEFAGAPFIGPIIFETYGEETGDRVPVRLLAFYRTYRAVLRAKLAAWHVKDRPVDEHRKWLARADAYLDLAESYAGSLSRASRPGAHVSSNSTMDPPS